MARTGGKVVAKVAPASRTALVALLAWGLGAGGAGAADTSEPDNPLLKKVVAHEALVAQHVKEKAVQALLADAKTTCALHKEVSARDDLRPRVLELLATVVKNVKDDGGRMVVIDCVGSTGDLDGMKIVKPYLRQPDREKSTPLLLSAIRVAGQLPVSESVETLLAMVEDSKVLQVSSAALEALGAFGKIKHKREKILSELCKVVAKGMPSTARKPKSTDNGFTNGGGEASQRWTTLAPLLPKTLNQLTGQSVSTAEQWFQVVRDTDDLGALFKAG